MCKLLLTCRNWIIGQTINIAAKTGGGVTGCTRNKSAYYCWCLTQHKRALCRSHAWTRRYGFWNHRYTQTFIEKYQSLLSGIRLAKLDCTAQFWLMYSDCVMIILRFQHSVKENNCLLHIQYLYKLYSLIFSTNHLNYAPYLPIFFSQLEKVAQTHPGAENMLKYNEFSVSRSNVLACRNANNFCANYY